MLTRPICENSQCRRCFSNIECSFGSKVCDQITGKCEECITNQDCVSKNPASRVCDPTNFNCRGCMNSNECFNSKICNIKSGRCESCISDQDCSHNQSYPTCSLETYQCIQAQYQSAAVTTATVIITTASAAVAPMVAVNPALLCGLMRILQRFFYLQFCNIEFPNNLKSFLAIFSLGKLTFLPDMIDFQIVEDREGPSPRNFRENGYQGIFYMMQGEAYFYGS